jgi:hypothetical protein
MKYTFKTLFTFNLRFASPPHSKSAKKKEEEFVRHVMYATLAAIHHRQAFHPQYSGSKN